MKFPTRISYLVCVVSFSVSGFALDREAFTFTNYDLNVRIEPEQQRLGVRGKITLRNDSSTAQRIAVLQISSSLSWRAITIDGKAPQFVLQPYTSDIDHTGALSEAIVTLPREIAPHGTVDLEIGYEGVITLDATRLTRIGAPEDTAKNSDWDRISANFTAVRGVGYVAWYPIATEAANLSDEDSLSEELGRWKQREAESQIHFKIDVSEDDAKPGKLIVNEPTCAVLREAVEGPQAASVDCTFRPLRLRAPSFAVGNYGTVSRPSITVFNLPTHAASASAYADVAEQAAPVIANWFGPPRGKLQVADLADPEAAPFGSGSLLLAPLGSADAPPSGLAAAYQMTHVAFWSLRPWIDEGLAHFAQALYLEQEKGRQIALDYLAAHRAALVHLEDSAADSDSARQTGHSLIDTTDEIYMQSKAMSVWWMLRDMIGETALKKAISLYRPEQDHDPSYMPRLIQAQTQRDLSWFFDDWVYRDRDLPDFKVASAFATKIANGTFMVTVTVENLGSAGAEVPLIVKFPGGELSQRLEVRGKNRATIRIESPVAPEEIVVNDGSVPESDVANNRFSFDTQSK
jgi:hypothetical protein